MQPFLNLSNNPHENTYLNAAQQLNIPFRIINGSKRYWLIGEKPGILLKWAILGANSAILKPLLRNKAASQSLLLHHGIPVPEFIHHPLNNDWETCLKRFTEFSASRYPVVIKPNDKSQAIGVFTNIRSAGEIARVLAQLQQSGFDSLIIEQHVIGKTYRGIVVDGELIDVVQWQLSTITGDGLSTVAELIDALNTVNTTYREVRIDDRLVEILSKNAVQLSSVPAVGHRIKLVDAGVYRGASRKRIPLDKIPDENRELFSKINQILGARLIGVDFICDDVTSPWFNQNFHVNEVNYAPGFGLNYPGGEENDFATVKLVLQRIFANQASPDNTDEQQPQACL